MRSSGQRFSAVSPASTKFSSTLRLPKMRRSSGTNWMPARAMAVGRAERTSFDLPFSQEIMADVLGLSVPHLNRVMQQLRVEQLITSRGRLIELTDMASLQTLAHYQPLDLAPIPLPAEKA